jgi:hypothetical protein
VSSLLFWQDVTDYGKEEDRSADRLLRLCHAWNIYNSYFPDGALYPIGKIFCNFSICHVQGLIDMSFVMMEVSRDVLFYLYYSLPI